MLTNRINREKLHQHIYFSCLVLLAIGLPTSRFLVSISQVLILINWVLEGSYREKLSSIMASKPAMALASIFLVFVAGMLYTNDLRHGFTYDLMNKLPFFTFPLVVASSKPLSQFKALSLPLLFGLSVLLVSFIGTAIYATNSFIDTRNLSPFTVHIFYGLMVLVSIFLIPWSVRQLSDKKIHFYISLIVSVWLVLFLFLLSSITVLASFLSVLIFLGAREVIFGKNILTRVGSGLAIVGFIGVSAIVITTIAAPILLKIEPTPASLNLRTALGNEYIHHKDNVFRENGHLVFWFIAEQEVEEAWNERSSIRFDGFDVNGHLIKYTIYRYLTSKGFKKDRAGVESLRPEDIVAIENGVANYLYIIWPSFFVRIHQSLWEMQRYNITGNPSGYSSAQRLDLWRASLVAIAQKPIAGWGTGDVLEALSYGLDSFNSQLENRKMKPHNQFLVWLIMVGGFGTLLIISLLLYFIIKSRAYQNTPMQVMLAALLVTMFSDMPFDYQMSINFILFMFAFFGIIWNGKLQQEHL